MNDNLMKALFFIVIFVVMICQSIFSSPRTAEKINGKGLYVSSFLVKNNIGSIPQWYRAVSNPVGLKKIKSNCVVNDLKSEIN